jgi:hypothetical protein
MAPSSRRAFLGGGVVVTLVALGCHRRAATCDDSAGLTPADRATRSRLGYVGQGSDPARRCDLCQQWEAAGASGCGGCRLLRGPIQPGGTCRMFAPRA